MPMPTVGTLADERERLANERELLADAQLDPIEGGGELRFERGAVIAVRELGG